MKKLKSKRKKFLVRKSKKTQDRATKRRKRQGKFHKRKQENSLTKAYERNLDFIKKSRKDITISPKNNLELLEHTNNVIEFISELKSYRNVAHEVKSIFIDLKDVISIDIGTISLLLSSVKELALYDINVKGNLPKKQNTKDAFIDSGYLEHMGEVSKSIKKSMRVSNKENLLLMLAKEKSESKKVGQCIKLGIKALTGKENHYPPVYGIIQEMNGNSVEHAYKDKKHWIMGINHDKIKNKLIFTFTDNGFGIIRTLKKRFNINAFKKMNWHTDEKILEGVFDKKYNSRFKKQYNRNKGLPVIKKAQAENKIKNLIVIANESIVNFNTGKASRLNKEFSGTFYYWELDLKTYMNGKNIN
ncbi:hypothetical protein DFQ05_2662 [Winogradskyella wandonensis]|uniref:Uncharacterized protein n=1 Tax=Winogradskyella wandonensis TaxID=1442586 RepID=A0A4R1KLD4_9FLAO|nr:hypothetical protein [Winogradskyella wandonensis]TCK64679.1 hypothetical protein DFQ05_2662 [Winogradskyella wandonensis]